MATCSGRPGKKTERAKTGDLATDEAVADLQTGSEIEEAKAFLRDQEAMDQITITITGNDTLEDVIGDLDDDEQMGFVWHGASVNTGTDDRVVTENPKLHLGSKRCCSTGSHGKTGVDSGCTCNACLERVPRFNPVVTFSDGTCEPINLGES